MNDTTAGTKHTPGPWVYDQSDCAIVSQTEKDEDGIPTKVVDLVGAMGGSNNGLDARLIAAAPDLLAAVEMFRDAWGDFFAHLNIGKSHLSARHFAFMNNIEITMDAAHRKATLAPQPPTES